MIFTTVINQYVDYMSDFYDEYEFNLYSNFTNNLSSSIGNYYEGITKMDFDILESIIQDNLYQIRMIYIFIISFLIMAYCFYATRYAMLNAREYQLDYLMGQDINENNENNGNNENNDDKEKKREERIMNISVSLLRIYERVDKNTKVYNSNFSKASRDIKILYDKINNLNKEFYNFKKETENKSKNKNENLNDDIIEISNDTVSDNDINSENNIVSDDDQNMSSDNYPNFNDTKNLKYDIIENLLGKWNNIISYDKKENINSSNYYKNNNINSDISPSSKYNNVEVRRSARLAAKRNKKNQ